MLRYLSGVAALVAAAAAFLAIHPAAVAAATDYRFVRVDVRPAGKGKSDVTLRLTHVPDSRPIPGAVIFQPNAIMAGMENMPGAATAEPGQHPGTYILHVATSMAGTWTLRLAAKVQGEPQTVRAAIPFEAAE